MQNPPSFFGRNTDGTDAHLYTLTNNNGLEMTVTEYGATITSLKVQAAGGELIDVVLGFDNLQDYIDSIELPAPPHFGAVIGRWAGRINKGKFKLNGKNYELAQNNGGHSLHGGRFGFSQVMWEVKNIDYDNASVTFVRMSPDGDEGFPGGLLVEVSYRLTESNELIAEYSAEAFDDTIINMTQHSYFNLDGHKGSIAGQQLVINADQILETNAMIPTGKLLEAAETPFDFRNPKNCPQNIDATFKLNQDAPAATLSSSQTGLKMTVFTDQPAVHIYVGGDCFGKISGKDAANYHPLSGICFETQNFPDAPNHAHFPNPNLLKGETYKQKTIFKFSGI